MPLLSMTTDFGTSDAYVGIMKAVVYGIAPELRIVDLCHHVPPQDLRHGALVLWSAMDVFGPGAIHLVVVDPGVGSARRGVMVRAGGQLFVGPDNGVMWPAIARFPSWEGVALESPVYQRAEASATFHGRDIFAPAAAHAAAGVPLHAFGPPIDDLLPQALFDACATPGVVKGRILAFDHFGNAITNIAAKDLKGQTPTKICVHEHTIESWSQTFSDGAVGGAVAFIDSFGLVEVALRNGSAQQALGLSRDDMIKVWLH